MIAYVAKDLGSGLCLRVHDTVRLPAFSTVKVLLAAAFWRAVERAELDAAAPYVVEPGRAVGGSGVLRGFRHAAAIALGDLVHLMLAVSDNEASNIVASAVGFARVNALADELGMGGTVMARLMCDAEAVEAGRENYTCAADLATLVEELAGGELLSAGVRQAVLASLSLQEHLDGIARYLPAGAEYAGKCGDDSPVCRYAHDFGLVGDGGLRAAVVVLSKDADGFEAVARTGAALFGALRDAADGEAVSAVATAR
jgi:beta-lactamase class A